MGVLKEAQSTKSRKTILEQRHCGSDMAQLSHPFGRSPNGLRAPETGSHTARHLHVGHLHLVQHRLAAKARGGAWEPACLTAPAAAGLRPHSEGVGGAGFWFSGPE